MNDLIRSTIYTGVGTLVLANKKFKELVEELIQHNHLTQDEGRRVVRRTIDDMEDARNDLERRLRSTLEDMLYRLNLPPGSELEVRIREFIDRLNHARPSLFDKDDTDKPLANS